MHAASNGTALGLGGWRACWQSSLVGTSTRPRGDPWAGPALSRTCSIGRRYAAVLPLPVLAWAMTSCSRQRGSLFATEPPHARSRRYRCTPRIRITQSHLALERERDGFRLHRRRRREAALRGRPHDARVEPQGVHGCSGGPPGPERVRYHRIFLRSPPEMEGWRSNSTRSSSWLPRLARGLERALPIARVVVR